MVQSKIEKRHVAIHEAGHAIARIRKGLYVGETTIESDEDSHGAVGGEEPWITQEGCEKAIMVLCAGYAALIAAGFDEATAMYGCEDDFAKATEHIEFWQLSPLRDWQQRTVELMRQPENIRAVQRLSDRLLEHGAVSGDHAEWFVAHADGEITDAELLDFIARFPVQDGEPDYGKYFGNSGAGLADGGEDEPNTPPHQGP